MSLKPGPGAKGECQRCGFHYRLRELRKEWTGLRVCRECFDPEPEERRPPRHIGPEGLPRPNAAPESAPVFIEPGVNDVQPGDL